jgi:hypothetical protein
MPKYQTVFIDPVGELARLYFSKAIKKHAKDMEALREIYHYTPTTERLNIFLRRMQDLRATGTNIVFSGHEQVDKIYAKGGAIAAKGQPPPEPIAIRGMPDLPGSVAPEELMRKSDCVLRMRMVNGKPMWIAKPEPLGGSAMDSPWTAGCRFNALALNSMGYLPASFEEIAKLASDKPDANFNPPYIWIIYGATKIGKTRLIAQTFPKPMKMYDLDQGSHVLGTPDKIADMGIDLVTYNTEECDDYDRFLADIASCF